VSWLFAYLGVGLLWGVSVTIARISVDGWDSYPRPYVWIPATIILWPWSVVHSVVDFYWGLRGR
jgi:hypothetical protein